MLNLEQYAMVSDILKLGNELLKSLQKIIIKFNQISVKYSKIIDV